MINPELIQLLQHWRDYHWQEAFAAHGPYTSLKHQSMAEGLDRDHPSSGRYLRPTMNINN